MEIFLRIKPDGRNSCVMNGASLERNTRLQNFEKFEKMLDK